MDLDAVAAHSANMDRRGSGRSGEVEALVSDCGSPRPAALRATTGVTPLVLCLVLLSVPVPAHGWGTAGHESIVRLAARQTTDPCLAGFWSVHLSTLMRESMTPDRWKVFDPGEPPRHYLNLDIAGDPEGYPQVFEDAVIRFGPSMATSHGVIPWRVLEMYELLVSQFLRKDGIDAAHVAGQLGHYVADAFSPLHATVDYDGQSVGRGGVHLRWEAEMAGAYRTAIEAAAAQLTVPTPAPDPVGAIFDGLREGLLHVDAILAADAAVAGDIDGLFERTGHIAELRWAQAATLLEQLWSRAWVEAGSPPLLGMTASCGGPAAPVPDPAPPPPRGCAHGGGPSGWLVLLTALVATALFRRRPRSRRG